MQGLQGFRASVLTVSNFHDNKKSKVKNGLAFLCRFLRL